MKAKALRWAVIYLAILFASSILGFAGGRISEANRTCNYAVESHRLIGPFSRCLVWNTIHAEDDDS